MDNRSFLEEKIPHFNGNKTVYGTLTGGTVVTLLYEESHLKEDEMMDVDTGMIFKRTDFLSFQNSPLHGTHLRTKNHHARNHYQYLTSGKNHKEEKGDLPHLIK
jgi:hypothetical protein